LIIVRSARVSGSTGLRFVIGHEMGHVVKNHMSKKIRMAYTASGVRKGIASQTIISGEVARSQLGGLAESLLKAQFSQLEEKEADDYGLAFLKKEKYNPGEAVLALRKLVGLGRNYSFLFSHPESEARAGRLQAQLEGKTLSIEENQQNILAKAKAFLEYRFPSLYKHLAKFFS
jgi:putative metalloprotease